MITTSTGQQFANVQEMIIHRRALVCARAAAIATYDAMIENITNEIEAAPTLRVVS